MTKRFVLRRTNSDAFFRMIQTTTRESAFWPELTEKQSEAAVYSREEAEVWDRCFKGLGYEMVECVPCADGHDFSEVELDEWSAPGVHELDVGLVITCRVCRQTASVSTTVYVEPRDWTVSG